MLNKIDVEYYIDCFHKKSNDNFPYNLSLYVSAININIDLDLFKLNVLLVGLDLNLNDDYIKIRISYPDEYYDDFVIQVLNENERIIKNMLE